MGGAGRLVARRDAELLQHGGDVVVDRAHREHEPLRDLRVREPLADQLEHVQLTLREAGGIGARGRARAAPRGHPGGAQPGAHASGRARGIHGVEDPQALGDGARVAGLGQLERLLVGVARVRPAVGGRPPIAAQARRPRLRAAVERLGGQAGAGQVARQLGSERRGAGVRQPRRERGRDALGDVRPSGQPRPLHGGQARVRDAEEQPLALGAVPGRGQQPAGGRVAAPRQRAAEPRHAVGEQHARVLDAVDEFAQARERAVEVAAAELQHAAVQLEVVGVRPEPALAGEREPVGDARLQLGQPPLAVQQLRDVAVAAGGGLVVGLAEGGLDAVAHQLQAAGIAALDGRDAEVVERERREVAVARAEREIAGEREHAGRALGLVDEREDRAAVQRRRRERGGVARRFEDGHGPVRALLGLDRLARHEQVARAAHEAVGDGDRVAELLVQLGRRLRGVHRLAEAMRVVELPAVVVEQGGPLALTELEQMRADRLEVRERLAVRPGSRRLARRRGRRRGRSQRRPPRPRSASGSRDPTLP